MRMPTKKYGTNKSHMIQQIMSSRRPTLDITMLVGITMIGKPRMTADRLKMRMPQPRQLTLRSGAKTCLQHILSRPRQEQ